MHRYSTLSQRETPAGCTAPAVSQCPVKRSVANAATRLPEQQCQAVLDLFRDRDRLESLPVDEFMAMFAT